MAGRHSGNLSGNAFLPMSYVEIEELLWII